MIRPISHPIASGGLLGAFTGTYGLYGFLRFVGEIPIGHTCVSSPPSDDLLGIPCASAPGSSAAKEAFGFLAECFAACVAEAEHRHLSGPVCSDQRDPSVVVLVEP